MLAPNEIYNSYESGEISSQEALTLLKNYIENSNDDRKRANSLEIIEKLPISDKPLYYKLIETSLVSDDSELVRATAAKTILNIFGNKAEKTVKYAIQHDKTVFFFKELLEYLKKEENTDFTEIKSMLQRKIEMSYDVEFTDARFLLDVDYQNYVNILSYLRKKYDPAQFNKEKEFYVKEYVQMGHYKRKWKRRVFSAKSGHIVKLTLWNVDTIPLSILSLPKLKDLALIKCNIKEFPKEFDKFSSLRKLRLSQCNIKQIPDWVLQIASKPRYTLRYLRNGVDPNEAPILGLLQILINGNPLKKEDLGSGLGDTGYDQRSYWIDNEGHVNKLFFESQEIFNFGIIPSQLCNLEHLQYLNFVNLWVTSLPECLSKLKNLRVINLNYTVVETFPTWLKKLENLEQVSFCIPEEAQLSDYTQYLSDDFEFKTNETAELGGFLYQIVGAKRKN
ncbi:MAG: leucine-rich repeat domain-containing protein [Candidatus Hodarchaeota archaeon]